MQKTDPPDSQNHCRRWWERNTLTAGSRPMSKGTNGSNCTTRYSTCQACQRISLSLVASFTLVLAALPALRDAKENPDVVAHLSY